MCLGLEPYLGVQVWLVGTMCQTDEGKRPGRGAGKSRQPIRAAGKSRQPIRVAVASVTPVSGCLGVVWLCWAEISVFLMRPFDKKHTNIDTHRHTVHTHTHIYTLLHVISLFL